MRKRCFQKTGCLMTADRSEDDITQPERLIRLSSMPPLPISGPHINAEFETPEPTSSENEEALNLDLDSNCNEPTQIGKSNI